MLIAVAFRLSYECYAKRSYQLIQSYTGSWYVQFFRRIGVRSGITSGACSW